MIGPYFWASFVRARCGFWPNMWRFPIIGSGRGPGGSFGRDFRTWALRKSQRSGGRRRRTRKRGTSKGGILE